MGVHSLSSICGSYLAKWYKYGEQTRSIRVPMSISTKQITSIPELQRIIDHWEDECVANPGSVHINFLDRC
jgi:hypothetical protein